MWCKNWSVCHLDLDGQAPIKKIRQSEHNSVHNLGFHSLRNNSIILTRFNTNPHPIANFPLFTAHKPQTLPPAEIKSDLAEHRSGTNSPLYLKGFIKTATHKTSSP